MHVHAQCDSANSSLPSLSTLTAFPGLLALPGSVQNQRIHKWVSKKRYVPLTLPTKGPGLVGDRLKSPDRRCQLSDEPLHNCPALRQALQKDVGCPVLPVPGTSRCMGPARSSTGLPA